jgi:hypothetical protein
VTVQGGRSLDVVAELELTVEGQSVQVVGYGDLVVVEAPTLGAALSLLRGTATLPTAEVGAGLRDADVTVDVRVRGVSVATLGPDADPGPLDRRLADGADVSLGGALLAVLGAIRARRR